jgi:hypothetical protein
MRSGYKKEQNQWFKRIFRLPSRPTEAFMRERGDGEMTDSVVRQMAALADLDMDGLKKLWTELYDVAPPGFNRLYMIKRLSYRIQELAYGGLSEETKEQIRWPQALPWRF